jgi:hypothetical protein
MRTNNQDRLLLAGSLRRFVLNVNGPKKYFPEFQIGRNFAA